MYLMLLSWSQLIAGLIKSCTNADDFHVSRRLALTAWLQITWYVILKPLYVNFHGLFADIFVFKFSSYSGLIEGPLLQYKYHLLFVVFVWYQPFTWHRRLIITWCNREKKINKQQFQWMVRVSLILSPGFLLTKTYNDRIYVAFSPTIMRYQVGI